MGIWTLFGQQSTGSGLTADPVAYTMGVEFSVSRPCLLNAIWFYSASGASVLPQTIGLYLVSGTSLVTSQSATWSGSAGSGWVRAAFSTGQLLSAGTNYKSVVLQATAVNWYSSTGGYWQAGAGNAGLTSGPLNAPNNAGASPGQGSFNTGAALAYPGSAFSAANYWVDPEVQDGPVPPSASQRSGLY